jgi:hypothetical protein
MPAETSCWDCYLAWRLYRRPLPGRQQQQQQQQLLGAGQPKHFPWLSSRLVVARALLLLLLLLVLLERGSSS